MAKTLTASRLRELLDYSPSSGVFKWRVAPTGRREIGGVAGCEDRSGYLKIGVDGRLYAAHRLAWLYVYGEWPVPAIDHINGVKTDNRITNLRAAGQDINSQNRRGANRGNTSGLLGVCWSRHHRKWIAQISANGEKVMLGGFDDRRDAYDAYLKAKHLLHPGNTLVHPDVFSELNRAWYKPAMVGAELPPDQSRTP